MWKLWKWEIVAFVIIVFMLAVSTTIQRYSENMAKRDIVTACYAARQSNCDDLMERGFR